MSKFVSITGLTINDEKICVKGSTFCCICESCKKEQQQRLKEFLLEEALQDKQKEIKK